MTLEARTTITVASVEDEPFAQRRIAHALNEIEGVSLIGSGNSAPEALDLVPSLQPDVLIIGINPNGFDSFQLLDDLKALGKDPLVIFTSALEDYAIRALEVGAVGYVLKPIETDKLSHLLGIAAERIGERAAKLHAAELQEVVATLRAQRPEVEPRCETELWVPWSGTYERLRIDEIDWIKAEGDYVRIYARSKSYLLRETMARMERRLGAQTFVRVHRSALVYQPKVELILRHSAGRYSLRLACGTHVPVGRHYIRSIHRWVAGAVAA